MGTGSKPNGYLMRGRAMTWGLAAAALASGCALESVDQAGNEEQDVATHVAAIKNSPTLVQKRGVVSLNIVQSGDDGFCTGAMIGPRYLITAAHCFEKPLGRAKSGRVQMTVRYFDPDLAAGKTSDITATNEEVDVFVKSTYAGGYDWESDIALVRRTSARRWTSTGIGDYLRLSMGSCDQIDRSNLYGAGAESFSGAGSGDLRTMPINIEECRKHYFWDLGGARRTCAGDSGGPYIKSVTQGGFPRDVVVGLHVGAETYETGGESSQTCTEDGEAQYAVRMNSDKANWIASTMESFGDVCFTHTATDGHKFKRCWEEMTLE